MHDEAACVDGNGRQHLQQQAVPGVGVDHVVELEVQRHQLVWLLAPAGIAHLLDDLAQVLEVGISQIGYRQTRRQAFQFGANVLNRDRVLERHARDKRATVGQARQAALALERADRFTYGLSTNPELARQIYLAAAFAPLEAATYRLGAQ